METIFKRGQVVVMPLRGLIATAGRNPDDYTPLVDGGCLVHKLRTLMHGTCNAANAAARAIVAAKVRAGKAQFGVEAWAALPSRFAGPSTVAATTTPCSCHLNYLDLLKENEEI